MYVVTRRRAPTAVVITRSDDLASPKSAIFTSPWNPTSTLPGVGSRCTRLSSAPARRAELVRRAEPAAERRADVDDEPLGEHLAGVEDGLHEPREAHALHELDGEVPPLLVRPPAGDLDHVRVA